MRKRLIGLGLALAVAAILSFAASAQIPTPAERIRESGRNPDLCAWRAPAIRIVPVPKLAEGEPWPVACYRKDFTLPAAPRRAAITLFPLPAERYSVSVNGKVVAPPLPVRHKGLRNLDLTPFLRAGHNALAFQGEAYGGSGLTLVAEGIVFCEDGSTLRLATDNTWRGAFDLPAGWDRPETDPNGIPPADQPFATPYQWSTSGEFNPPYYGPIQVTPAGLPNPIFDAEKPVALEITLLNAAGMPAPVLSFEVFDEIARKTVNQGSVPLAPRGKLDLAGGLRHAPLPAGAYRFRFVLTSAGNVVDRRDYEAACVGPIRQRPVEGTSYEEGLDLKEVARIDCAAEPRPGQLLACDWKGNDVETCVESGPAGRYRTLAENREYLSFAYRFKVKRLYVPHLVVVEWPDDAPRSFLSHVVEGTTMLPDAYKFKMGGFQRGDAGMVSVEEQPARTNRMQKLHLLYWPNEEEASIHFWNLGLKAPPAVSRIIVHEITNDLPALRITDAGDRMIGYHTERGPWTMTANFYAGPLGAFFNYMLAEIDHPEFYRNWYATTENMIKFMRFSGQNMYLMGHFMYWSVLYPSKHYIFAQNNHRAGDGNRDYVALILRMFQRNGMSLVSSLEYVNTPDLAAEFPATDEEIRAGAPTVRSVSRAGKTGGLYGGVNYFHPRVRQSVLTVVDELVDLCKDYPAWKGINLILSRQIGGPLNPGGWGPTDDPLDWGYEDYTIDLFQKATGTRIPVDGKDPERFQKRYDWLKANAWQQWVDWRCGQYTRIYREIRDRLVKARPDLKLYLTSGEPVLSFMSRATKQALDLDGHFEDPAAMRRVVKSFGLDPDALRKEPGIVCSYFYSSPGTLQTYAAKHRTYYAAQHSQQWHDLWANDGKGGAYVWSGIYHSGYSLPEGKWLFQESLNRQGYLWPAYVNDTFVNVLVRSNPTWIPHTWEDVTESGGRLHEMRLFARAYRSLPNGRYERLAENGLDRNVWVERTLAKGAEYAYAANPHWWSVDVSLSFAPQSKVHDLIKDRAVALKGGRWAFRLGPYEVQTFRVTGGASRPRSAVTAARVAVLGEVGAAVDEKIQKAQEVLDRARARESDLRGLPGWQRVADLAKRVAEARALKTQGDLSRAYEIAASWEMEQSRQQVVAEALEAIPMLVLGPFGDPADTEGAGQDTGNPEVTPGYRGMETAYIPETGGLDLAKEYRVYPDKPARWQDAWNTGSLSFAGKGGSEHPFWMAAYAYTEVYSPVDREVVIRVGSPHAICVRVNDQIVVTHGGQGTPRGGQRAPRPDQNSGAAHLQKGWNRVLIKAIQRGNTEVFFRLTGKAGESLDDLRFRVPKVR
ncbi:MAG: hypothetical protein HY321_13955 [Armatimonadetes bacterium]|nr:hypothetical protein [Armatimonadota bacterium]